MGLTKLCFSQVEMLDVGHEKTLRTRLKALLLEETQKVFDGCKTKKTHIL